MAHQPTTFYSASAGSGKTYTLARDYLALLFQNSFHNGYREILAITFTNKAVAEMKERILENLHELTKPEIPSNLVAIRDYIKALTGLDNEGIQNKAIKIEQKLLHDYAAFDIVTIDSFNHRILRTFAREVELPNGFEIELDSHRLIAKAIHNLLARAGKEKELTHLLVDFSLTKIDEGKSWDIEHDLHQIASLILSESHYPYIQKLKSKSIADFLELRSLLRYRVNQLEKGLLENGAQLMSFYKSHGLTENDFKGKSRGIFGWIKKLADGELPKFTQPKYLGSALEDSVAGNTSDFNKTLIEGKQDQLVQLINDYNSSMGHIGLYSNALSKLTALSLLNEVMLEIDAIKLEEQIVPIYEFNGILSQQIKDQPAPFIYERLGEKYRHYFIDEFQDTSTMQWENLMPLIENPLVQLRDDGSQGSLMLVGDAKQSIYRWRGGDADQFLDILNNNELFLQPKQNQTLETNWRSYDTIVQFNNDLFSHYGTFLEADKYQGLYLEYLQQQTNNKPGGYVQIDFLKDEEHEVVEEDPELNSIYPVHVKQQIDQALGQGFLPNEICVLVRQKKHGDAIARYLVRQGLSVVSTDSLLVNASPRVQLLVQFMRMSLYTAQQQPRYEFLLQYAVWKKIPKIHSFIKSHLELSLSDLVKKLIADGADLDLAFAKAPLFQATEKVASVLGLFEDHDTRLQAFLEHIFEFGTGFEKTASSFLEAWESKKESLSVPAAEDPTAIQIMTIHKSKGLEFPVVIVPYCDVTLGEVRGASDWYPVDPKDHVGFEHLFITLKKDCLTYSPAAATMYQEELQKNQMDQINTLYVAFTRAKEQLYVSCFENEKDKSTYAKVLKQFTDQAEWSSTEKDSYRQTSIGLPIRVSTPSAMESGSLIEDYVSNSQSGRVAISTRKGMLWASGALDAIDSGTQLHHYLSLIKTNEDIPKVEKQLALDQSLSKEMKNSLLQKIKDIIYHDELKPYYAQGVDAVNEQPILSPSGSQSIPDRLLFDGQQVTVIDYKTGTENSNHKNQVNQYAALLQEMQFTIKEKLLIYTDTIKVVRWD